MEAARRMGAAGVLEVNAPLVEEQATHRMLVDRAGAEAAVRRSFAAAGAIVAVSEELRRRLDGHREAGGKVRVFPNAVDPERFPPRPRRPHGRPFTVPFVGALDRSEE